MTGLLPSGSDPPARRLHPALHKLCRIKGEAPRPQLSPTALAEVPGRTPGRTETKLVPALRTLSHSPEEALQQNLKVTEVSTKPERKGQASRQTEPPLLTCLARCLEPGSIVIIYIVKREVSKEMRSLRSKLLHPRPFPQPNSAPVIA